MKMMLLTTLLMLLMLLMAMGSADTTNTKDEAVQIKRFGKYGVEDFKTTVNCGASINWFNNVTVCSNGNYQGTSNSCGSCDFTGKVCQFQSFEYAARYLKQNGGIDYSQWRWNATTNMDDDPCLAYPWPYIVQVNSDPVPGDMIVIYMGNAPQGQRYHHSAIVTQFLPPTYINVVEQNAASSGSNTYQRVQVECILRVNSTQLHG